MKHSLNGFRWYLQYVGVAATKRLAKENTTTQIWTVFLEKRSSSGQETSVSLCHHLQPFASSCIIKEGPSVLDIRKESSHSVQYLVQRRLKELICGCFYEVGECAEWPLEENGPTAYWEWWSMMPLFHAGLHLLYPQRVNMTSATEYKEDVQVMSRKHLHQELNLNYFWICLAQCCRIM